MSPWVHTCPKQPAWRRPVSIHRRGHTWAWPRIRSGECSTALPFGFSSRAWDLELGENEPLSAFPAECSTTLPWSAASISRHLEVSKRPFLGVLGRGRSGPLSGPCGCPRLGSRVVGQSRGGTVAPACGSQCARDSMTADVRGGAARHWDCFRVGDHSPRSGLTRYEAMANESGSPLLRLGRQVASVAMSCTCGPAPPW